MPEYTAVLDRFEGEEAVLLLERDGETIADLVVPREDLPRRARTQDAVLNVVVEDGELVRARYLSWETRRRRNSAQSRFDRLSRRPPRGDDDADDG